MLFILLFRGKKTPAKLDSSSHKLCGIEACIIALGICDAQIIFLCYPPPSKTNKKFKMEKLGFLSLKKKGWLVFIVSCNVFSFFIYFN